MPIFDGIASIVIGLILCGVAGVLVWESKKLIIGEAADPVLRADVRSIAEADPGVKAVGRLLTLHMGPQTLILNMDLTFNASLDAAEIETAIDRVERAIREAHDEVAYIFLEAKSLAPEARSAPS
jgi:divalent metal cation (Fe/Co/Zn/Cd) transporter